MTILVLGRSGQVARALAQHAATHSLSFEFAGRDTCDLADSRAVEQAIMDITPSAIINAAAYTGVDGAETDAAAARAVNDTGPAAAARVAANEGIPFIHLSTDYVFDGSKSSPYLETDTTNPVNVYGLTKRDGEISILATHSDAIILRTSWVYSRFGKNFLRTMLTLAQTREALSIVDDQTGAPTSAQDIAAACISIVDAKLAGKSANGIFHMTNGGATTWLGFASAALTKTAAWRDGKVPVMTGVPTSAYPTPARRPLNSRLNCDLLAETFGIRLPMWDVSLTDTMRELAPEFSSQYRAQ